MAVLKSDGMDDMRENIWSSTEVCQKWEYLLFYAGKGKKKIWNASREEA